MRSRWTYYCLITIVIITFHVPGIWMFLFLQFPKQGPGNVGDALFNLGLILAWGMVHSLLARGFAQRLIARWTGGAGTCPEKLSVNFDSSDAQSDCKPPTNAKISPPVS